MVTLPEHIGAADSGAIREQLLELLDRGAAVLIADMTGTLSCDRSAAAALVHACQRASDGGAQLRVAVTAPAVRQVLEASGLDRLVSIYPSVEAAIAAGAPGVIPLLPRPGPSPGERRAGSRRRRVTPDKSRAGISPAALWGLVDALADGVVLASEDGVLVLANRRAEDMFGSRPGELIGQPVESLVPAGLRTAHVTQRAGYTREPVARPMGSRVRLAAQRQDGSTFPVRVSLSPVVTGTSRFILAVIQDVTEDRPPAVLADADADADAAAAAAGPRPTTLAAAGSSSAGWSTTCSASASAWRPRPTCLMRRPFGISPAPCRSWMTRSVRSVTTCSPHPARTGRQISSRPARPGRRLAWLALLPSSRAGRPGEPGGRPGPGGRWIIAVTVAARLTSPRPIFCWCSRYSTMIRPAVAASPAIARTMAASPEAGVGQQADQRDDRPSG